MVRLLDISGSDLLCSEDNALDTAVACERTQTSSLGRYGKQKRFLDVFVSEMWPIFSFAFQSSGDFLRLF